VHLAPHNHHSWTTSCSSVADLLDPALPLEHEGYDAVTAVSSLHHMPLQPALGRLAGLVRPGGVLALVSWRLSSTPTSSTPTGSRLAARSSSTPEPLFVPHSA